jgi:hypothetical protein
MPAGVRSSIVFTSRADANKQGWKDYRQWLAGRQQRWQQKGTCDSPAAQQAAAAAHNLSPAVLGQKRTTPGKRNATIPASSSDM